MKLGLIAATVMLLCASPLFSLPSEATESTQQRGSLPRGGSYVLDPDPTIGVAAIALWFRAPGAGYDNGSPGIARLAATAAAAAPLASGKSLVQLVHSVGGELSINAYPDIVGVDAIVPSSSARRVVAAITSAYFAPAIDDSAVKTAQRDAAVLAVQQRYSTDLMLHDLLFKQIFADGPAHYSPLPDSVAQITRISSGNVTAFARRAFRSGNAVLTLAGNVDDSSISAVTDGSGDASMDAPFDSVLSRSSGTTTASGSVPGVGLAWVGPPISDEKAATALDFVADYLFRDETGVVSKALDAQNIDAYVAGQFITLHDPGVMLVTIGGDNGASVKPQVLEQLAKMERPMDAQTFAAAREAFLYHIASDTQTSAERVDNLGWYAVEGNPSYAPGDDRGMYERTARTLDPQYVSEIVRRYLENPVTINLVTPAPTKESTS
jgi:predicted Zn-dependent peptidase